MNMHKTFIAGAGTIGSLIALRLADSGDYDVYLVDNSISHLSLPNFENLHVAQLDVTNEAQLKAYLQSNSIQITISSLPYFLNKHVAKLASELHLYYFDLTEDVKATEEVRKLAQNQETAFVPQCGVAPGFINIVANCLMSKFDKISATHLRAGSLPRNTHNALQYAVTWSLDGLINEYGNTCYGLVNGQKTALQPLDDIESVELDGTLYEAFNTSGGVGSLIETYQNRVEILNYKTLRYPGHCEKMRFLMFDLHLNEDRNTLKRILENSLPHTNQDVMLLYVSIMGEKSGENFEENYVNKLTPKTLFNRTWSAIQITTASSLCAVVDLVMNNPAAYKGFILQEQFSLDAFLNNRFGCIYKS